MREVPDIPLKPWTPPKYAVDANGKVIGAKPGLYHNWSRWGEQDQLGTANLLTPELAVAAAGLVHRGDLFSLALPIGRNFEGPGTRPNMLHAFMSTTADVVVGDAGDFGLPISDDLVVLPLQGSTQLDGLGHFSRDGVLYNGYWAGLVTSAKGARRLGVHWQSNGIIGRGVLLDVARVLGTDAFESTISAEMLQYVADEEKVSVGTGDIVLIRTGFVGTWLARSDLRKRKKQSGLTLDTIQWFHGRDVAMVASDNGAVESVPGNPAFPVGSWHAAALCDLGLLVGELFDLDELSLDCERDGVYEFMFMAAPLPIINAVGSPLNPMVLK